MPTSYTHDIAKGITFKEYALGCARAFGATITMRDEPHDTPIPDEFSPSDYHKNKILALFEELAKLSTLDSETSELKAKAEFDGRLNQLSKWIQEKRELETKYRSMLAQAENYVSPSPDHDNFKKFMESQIRESIEFDCSVTHHQKAIMDLRCLSGDEWIESEKSRIGKELEYHKKEHQSEIERANGRTQWISKLKASLA